MIDFGKRNISVDHRNALKVLAEYATKCDCDCRICGFDTTMYGGGCLCAPALAQRLLLYESGEKSDGTQHPRE